MADPVVAVSREGATLEDARAFADEHDRDHCGVVEAGETGGRVMVAFNTLWDVRDFMNQYVHPDEIPNG